MDIIIIHSLFRLYQFYTHSFVCVHVCTLKQFYHIFRLMLPLPQSRHRTVASQGFLALPFQVVVQSPSHVSMDCSTPGLPVPHHLPEFAQLYVHCIGDVIKPSHPLMISSTSALNLSQHQKQKKVKSLSHIRFFATPWTVAHKAPLVHGIFQARVLEWVAISFSRGSSKPRDQTWVSHIAGRCFTI